MHAEPRCGVQKEHTLPDKRKPPVLLVDDEPDILLSLKGLLRLEFDLFIAENAREALRILDEHRIHVVMTDQRMPETTGVEMLSQVRARFPDTICIMFTGYADIKAVVDAINTAGLYRYITKPWDPDDLIALLHEAAAHHDHLIEQRQLLIDIRDHFAECRSSAPGQPNEFQAREGTLSERIERLIQRDAHG
jgi:DNA-binding NtrC family response regulator